MAACALVGLTSSIVVPVYRSVWSVSTLVIRVTRIGEDQCESWPRESGRGHRTQRLDSARNLRQAEVRQVRAIAPVDHVVKSAIMFQHFCSFFERASLRIPLSAIAEKRKFVR